MATHGKKNSLKKRKTGERAKELPEFERRLIFVLGMHRSGTSMITRLINMSGAALPRNLLPAREDNETGYWEALGGMVLNDQILASLDLSWRDAGDVPEDWFRGKTAEAFTEQIADLLGEELQDAPLAVFKDPRISRLLPLWRAAAEKVGWTCSAVLMLRDPREVAASLHLRNEIPFPSAAILWLRYVLEAERASRDLPRVVMSYDEVLSDWRSSLAKIAIGLKLGDRRIDSAIEEEADSFVSPERKHHVAEMYTDNVPQVALRIYRDLIDPACSSRSRQVLLDKLFDSLKTIGPVLPPILHLIGQDDPTRDAIWARVLDSMLEGQAAMLGNELAEITSAMSDMNAEITASKERLVVCQRNESQLRESLAQAMQSIASEREFGNHAVSRHEELAKILVQAEAKLAVQAQLIDDMKLDAAEIRSKLDYATFLEQELRSGNEAQSIDLRRLENEKDALESEVARLRSSLRSREALVVRWALRHGIFNGGPDFDEAAYLEANPDVKYAISKGDLGSGFEHWVRWGFEERRPACFVLPSRT